MKRQERILTAKDGKLYFDGKPYWLLSGDIQYFRIHQSDWEKRLKLMKEFGLTAIQTYCPWNLHEPRRGVFDFSGMLNLEAFLDTVEACGMQVLLRPSPFICGEWEFGGMPAWLLDDAGITLRSCDERYLSAVDEYYCELCSRIEPYLSTNGGPILAVALENEFGGISLDVPYLEKLAGILRKYGVDVPFYTTDGNVRTWIRNGTIDGTLFEGINYRALPGEAKKAWENHRTIHPDKPFFVGELWAGRKVLWGDSFHHRNPHEIAEAFREALELGAYINFYMFAGGTNFGMMNGAVIGRGISPRPEAKERYLPHATSYDEDALIGENGVPTEKYYLCRDVLDRFLGKPVRKRKLYPYRVQKIGDVELTESAYLLEQADILTEKERNSVAPLRMDEIGQDYGFLLYSKEVSGFGEDLESSLVLEEMNDRATVYKNGAYVGENMRDRNREAIPFVIPKNGIKLDILVENMGRINAGPQIYHQNQKGISGDVRYNGARLLYWKNRSIPLRDLSGLHYESITDGIQKDLPVFLRGTFQAEAGVDAFLCTEGFTRGLIWINGFCIGRFWEVGPQMTLYIPGALLHDGENVIEVFDTNPKQEFPKIKFSDQHQLERDCHY